MTTPKTLALKAERKIDEIGSLLADEDNPTQAEIDFLLDKIEDFTKDIAGSISPIADATIIAAADTWHDCPADFIQAYTVGSDYVITKDGVEYTGYPEFRQLGFTTQVRFTEAGTYVIKYEQTPTRLATISDTITMHPLLAELGAIYLAWQYLEFEHADSTPEDQSVTAAKLEAEYKTEKQSRVTLISNPSGQPRQIKAVY